MEGGVAGVSSEDAGEGVGEGFRSIGSLGGTVDGGRLRLARVDANAQRNEDVGVDGDATVDGVDDVGDESLTVSGVSWPLAHVAASATARTIEAVSVPVSRSRLPFNMKSSLPWCWRWRPARP